MKILRNERILTLLDWLCRLGLAAAFFAAAVPKLMDPAGFAKTIENYRLVLPLIGKDYINLTALFLPALEFVTAAAILWPKTKRAAAWLITGMLVLFIIMIAQAVLRGLNIDCGCFGAAGAAKEKAHMVGISTILRDVGFLLMSGFVLWRGRAK